MNRKNWMYTGGTAVVLIGLIVAGYVLTHGSQSSKAADAPPDAAADSYTEPGKDEIDADDNALKTAGIQTTTVESHDMPVTMTLTGRTGLNMDNVTHVHAQFGGKVREIKPELGAIVKGPEAPGGATVLCVIESNDLAQAKAGYLQAKVQLKLDQDNLDRTRELVKSTVLAEKFLLDAQSAVTKDAALLEAARQQLLVFGLTQAEIDQVDTEQGRQRMDYIITSPRSGVIAEKGVSGGEIADPTINLFTVADTSTMWVWGDVYERDLSRIKVGDVARTVFTSDPDHPRECKIEWISPVLDPNSHSIRVRGTIDNKDGRLLADMYGTMSVTVDAGKGAIVVPGGAVVREGTDAYVFVLLGSSGGKTRFQKTKVTVEPLDVGFGTTDVAASGGDTQHADGDPATGVRIVKGLQSGQVIVRTGALGLSNEMAQHPQ